MKSRITDSEGRPVRWWVSPPKPKEPEEDLRKLKDGTTISVVWEPIMIEAYVMPWRGFSGASRENVNGQG